MFLEGAAASRTALMCGRNAIQIREAVPRPLALDELRRRLQRLGPVQANDFLVRCRFDSYKLTVFRDGRVIIKGTDDPAVARKIYAQ
jgi:molybdopterin-synthase adenylyltransferase